MELLLQLNTASKLHSRWYTRYRRTRAKKSTGMEFRIQSSVRSHRDIFPHNAPTDANIPILFYPTFQTHRSQKFSIKVFSGLRRHGQYGMSRGWRVENDIPSGWARMYSTAFSTIRTNALVYLIAILKWSKLTAVDLVGLLVGDLNAELLLSR